MTPDRIVEVYSAGNIVEAESLVEVLEEAGVVAQVVGDVLGNAAGWIPAAEAAPRVWVRAADEARAREIIAKWVRNPRAIVAEGAPGEPDEAEAEPPEAAFLNAADDEEPDEPTESEEAEGPGGTERGDGEPSEAEQAEELSPSEERSFGLVSRAIAAAGVVGILVGVYFAVTSWLAQRRFSEETVGRYIGYEEGNTEFRSQPAAMRDLPVRFPSFNLRVTYYLYYCYEVGGKDYYAMRRSVGDAPITTPIHYDPDRPAENIVGPRTPPWVPLLIGLAVGGLLFFVASRFR